MQVGKLCFELISVLCRIAHHFIHHWRPRRTAHPQYEYIVCYKIRMKPVYGLQFTESTGRYSSEFLVFTCWSTAGQLWWQHIHWSVSAMLHMFGNELPLRLWRKRMGMLISYLWSFFIFCSDWLFIQFKTSSLERVRSMEVRKSAIDEISRLRLHQLSIWNCRKWAYGSIVVFISLFFCPIPASFRQWKSAAQIFSLFTLFCSATYIHFTGKPRTILNKKQMKLLGLSEDDVTHQQTIAPIIPGTRFVLSARNEFWNMS